jgi:alpha-ketoglutarate-dependent taurine dioxygenase
MTMSLTGEPLATTSGRLITAAPGDGLENLDPAALFEGLAASGFLVLRGFEATLASYSDLVARCSTRITLDPARVFHTKVAQKVDAGLEAVELHQENATTPFVPHFVWLFCEQAAASGSQTTVCDGYELWDALSAPARKAFAQQDLLFAREVSEGRWKQFVHMQLEGRKPVEEIGFDDLLGFMEDPASTHVEQRADGRIYYEFRTPAVHPTRFGERLAFCNGMLTEAVYYEPPKVGFADGTEIPAALKDEVRDTAHALIGEIAWTSGDVLLLDNTRVMHGRRAITDPDRTLFNAQSYLD